MAQLFVRLVQWLHGLCHRLLKLEPEDIDGRVQAVLLERLKEMLEAMGPELMAQFLEMEAEGENTQREARDGGREIRLAGRG